MAYMWSLKKKIIQMNLFKQKKTDSQTQRTNFLPEKRVGGRDRLGVWD